MKSVNMEQDAKLSVVERVGYGLGDYANNLVCSAINAFLLVYYTNVVGANAAIAASIIAISKIFDGISDLAMGYLVDHTHSRFGKTRPWLLRLCLPLAVCTVLMFSVPASLTGKAQTAYMFITYNLVSTVFYTGISVPYATLHGMMTTNQYERGLLGNFRMLLATAGTMTINTVVLKMTGFFGNGDIYNQKGWTMTFAVLMIIMIALYIFVFVVCHERVVDEAADSEDNQRQQAVPFVKGIVGLLKNKYWVIIVICLFAMYFMMSCFYGSAYYFAQYNLGDSNKYALIANVLSISQIATMFVTPFLMKILTKRQIMNVGICIAFVGFAGTGFTNSYPVIVAMSVVKGIGFGCSSAVGFGLLQDSITYGEWQNGYSSAGMGNAASSFCMKLGSGFGTAALGAVLSVGGFDAAAATQSSAALRSISMAFTWLPVITIVVSIICLIFFDIDKRYPQALKDLKEGKHRNEK